MSSPLKLTHRRVFGSFLLGESEFAIASEYLREVIQAPESYSPVPMSPSHILGVFDLRGSAVPVVDLNAFFGFEQTQAAGNKKIAVIEHENLCFGLLFDSAREIFDGSRESFANFVNSSNNEKAKVIGGVYRVGEEKRMVQVLDPKQILKLADIPLSPNAGVTERRQKSRGKKKQAITFETGGQIYAIEIDKVNEIVRPGEIERNAFANEICLGSIKVRDEIYPLMGLAAILGHEPSSDQSERRALLLQVSNDPKDGKVAILVSRVRELESFYEEELAPFSGKNKFAKGSIQDSEAVLLDPGALFSDPRIRVIAAGHHSIFLQTEKEASRKSGGELRTYITFSVAQEFALEIGDIDEVIDCAGQITPAPNMRKGVAGMVNIRGELVPLIDPGAMFPEIRTLEKESLSKALIFKMNGEKHGLLVESVNEILSFSGEKTPLPKILFTPEDANAAANIIKEAIIHKHQSGKDKMLMILDPKALLRSA